MPTKPKPLTISGYPVELKKTYWKSKRAATQHGLGVGKICDNLGTEYDKVDWLKIQMKVPGERGVGCDSWGGFVVSTWADAYADAVREVKGKCKNFKLKCFEARDSLNEINTGVSKIYKGTKAALTIMADKADKLGVSINSNSLLGPLKSYHDDFLTSMQEQANMLTSLLVKAREKLPTALVKAKSLKGDVATDYSKISGILYKACRDITQNTANLAKVAGKGLGNVDASVVSQVSEVLAVYGNAGSGYFTAESTPEDVEEACTLIENADARLD
ncbi:MAG: hypothetical protein ACJAT5_000438 [Lentimonas sp.]|jgi:hypothetical protein